MLTGQTHNIRTLLKDGGLETRENIEDTLSLSILFLANAYTGANFSNPPTEEQQFTINACTTFVVEMFPMIGLKEIELAFKMASAGKFHKLNLETYYGKFTVQFLGKVLNAYLTHRKKVLGTYSEQERLERNKQVKEDLDFRNENTHVHVLESYEKLKANWSKHGNIESLEKIVCSYWAKILVKQGKIVFTLEEKREILKESKIQVECELKKELDNGENQKPAHRRTLTGILQRIANNEQEPTFKLKVLNMYSKLIIIKSIING